MKKVSLTFFQYRFTFSGVSILLFVSIFLFLSSLGVWQLRRADQKRQWLALHQNSEQKKSINIQNLRDVKRINYASIELVGHYENHPIIFLDNKMYHHQVGYQVLVPFVPDEGDRLVWVNRGWIPRGKSRNTLPELKLPTGKLSLKGIIHLPEKAGVLLGQNLEKLSSHFWRLQFLQLEILNQHLKQPFYPFEILLILDDAGDAALWVRDWKPVVSVTPERHVGYAVQWFGLSAAFLVIFVLVHARRLR